MAVKPKLAYLAYIIYPDKEMEFLGLASTNKEASKLFNTFKLPERYSEEDISGMQKSYWAFYKNDFCISCELPMDYKEAQEYERNHRYDIGKCRPVAVNLKLLEDNTDVISSSWYYLSGLGILLSVLSVTSVFSVLVFQLMR